MTKKLIYREQTRHGHAILPVVAKAAIVALPLVSTLSAAAQQAAGYTEMKDTTKKKTASTAHALGSSMGAKGIAGSVSDENSLRNALNYLGRKTGMPSDKLAKLPYNYGEAENLVVKDTMRGPLLLKQTLEDTTADSTGFSALLGLMASPPIQTRQVIATDILALPLPALNMVSLGQTAKPTAAMVGDVISQLNIEYMSEYAGYVSYGWKVMKIDAKGVEVAPTLRMEVFMSEHASGDYVTLGVRIPYGTKKVVSGGPSRSGQPLKLPLEVSVSKGQKPGTASISAVFLHPERELADSVDGVAPPPFIHVHDTSLQRTVKVGEPLAAFGKVSRIDAKGVEFSTSDGTYRLDYGQKRTIGEYALSWSMTPQKGKAQGTAILTITMPVVPQDSAGQ